MECNRREPTHSTAYDKNGATLFTTNSGENNNISYIIKPYAERAAELKSYLSKEVGKKGTVQIEEIDKNIIKLTQKIDELDSKTGVPITLKAVSYINTRYGIPVISETYDSNGILINKLTQLYKMINDVPIVAYEEAISFEQSLNGEIIEHKTISNYENIQLSTF